MHSSAVWSGTSSTPHPQLRNRIIAGGFSLRSPTYRVSHHHTRKAASSSSSANMGSAKVSPTVLDRVRGALWGELGSVIVERAGGHGTAGPLGATARREDARPRQTRRNCPVLSVDRLLAEVA